jgi:myo-inositol-1(or 4)-monophosphatase
VQFAITILSQVTEIGIVYNPVLKQKFTARRGQGAFHNGVQIHVSGEKILKYCVCDVLNYNKSETEKLMSFQNSGEKKLSKALLTTEFGTSREEEKTKVVLENISKLVRLAHGFRSLGAAALNICMVALGGADVYYEYGIHAWGESGKV